MATLRMAGCHGWSKRTRPGASQQRCSVVRSLRHSVTILADSVAFELSSSVSERVRILRLRACRARALPGDRSACCESTLLTGDEPFRFDTEVLRDPIRRGEPAFCGMSPMSTPLRLRCRSRLGALEVAAGVATSCSGRSTLAKALGSFATRLESPIAGNRVVLSVSSGENCCAGSSSSRKSDGARLPAITLDPNFPGRAIQRVHARTWR
jgi:hypothetical protein